MFQGWPVIVMAGPAVLVAVLIGVSPQILGPEPLTFEYAFESLAAHCNSGTAVQADAHRAVADCVTYSARVTGIRYLSRYWSAGITMSQTSTTWSPARCARSMKSTGVPGLMASELASDSSDGLTAISSTT